MFGLRPAALEGVAQLVAVRFRFLAGVGHVGLGVAFDLVGGHLVVPLGLEFGHGSSFPFRALAGG
jgi:hypothetical protein